MYIQQPVSRAGFVVRTCAAKANTLGDHAAEEETARQQNRPSPPVLLRDIFSPKRGGGEWSGAGKSRALDRLDRLQEVANLALQDRATTPGGEPWGCADIGAGVYDEGKCSLSRESRIYTREIDSRWIHSQDVCRGSGRQRIRW